MDGGGADDAIICGEFEGVPAFHLPVPREILRRGLVGNLAVTALFLVLGGAMIVLDAPAVQIVITAVGLALVLGYFVRGSVRSIRLGSDLVLTEREIISDDAGVIKRANWIEVGRVAPFARGAVWLRTQNQMLRITTMPGAVRYEGRASLGQQVDRKVGAEMVVFSERRAGGSELLVSLLTWCKDNRNRPLIGTEAGRDSFLAWQAGAHD